ncbi:MAG: lipopolysaccharide exporter [Saprospiraceae bacterium]
MSKSQKSYYLKSGLLTILERGSVFVFGFGGFALLSRAFPKEELGIWVIFYTLTSFIEVGRSGLLQNALVKYLTNATEKEYPVINAASLGINLCLTGLFIFALCLFAYPTGIFFDAPVLTTMMLVYCATAIAMALFHQFNFIQMANLDFRGTFWSSFIKQGLFFLFILIVVLGNWEITLVKLAVVQILTTIAGVIVNYYFAKPYLRFSKTFDRVWMKKLFDFGRFVFGTNISTMVYKSIDKMMLGSLIGPAAAAIYEWPIKISNLTEVPTFSIASIVFPKAALTSNTDGKDGLKNLYEKSVGSILGLIIPFILFVFLFAELIILLLAGPEYHESIRILQYTIFFGCFIPFAVLFGTILDAMGKPKINFYFTIVGSIINVISNYIFITNYGVIGAAYGTLTSYAITFIGQQYILYKLLDVKAYRALTYIPDFYNRGITLARNFLTKKRIVSKTEL